ncbi:MAG: porin [Hyphomicrobiales bacterium]|nr:porin [Hyphomicrobiales bacterium]
MKKILLGTSALVSAVALAGSASANSLDVTVGGFIDFQAGFTDQDSAFETGANSREAKFQNDTEVHVSVDGQADNGLKYGAVIELNADVSADGNGDGGNADKTYIYLESDAGRLELGANTGAQNTMAVSAATIARATGGVDGDWYDFVNTGGTTGTVPFILTQELPGAEAAEGGTREDANKITYYTPRFSGVQLGVSYTPDEGDSGTAAAFTGELNGDNENVFGLGLNYAGEMDGVGLHLSATGEFGNNEVATTEDLAAYALGAVVSFEGFSLGGSWTDWSDSGLAVGTTNDTQQAWTLGAAYETGPFGVSVTYLDSEQTSNDFTNLVVGADYQLAPGLVPYVEVSFFDLDQGGTSVDNDGTVVLVGTELNF